MGAGMFTPLDCGRLAVIERLPIEAHAMSVSFTELLARRIRCTSDAVLSELADLVATGGLVAVGLHGEYIRTAFEWTAALMQLPVCGQFWIHRGSQKYHGDKVLGCALSRGMTM
ncbi:hypothetical protein COCOBI_10-3680 [Coccomyxa sp. Obi]|nr:hypothetical protein COCOBI_10-3680 [Coccomyxa sp. Obi]